MRDSTEILNVLTFDLGTKTGWAARTEEGIVSGTGNFGRKTHEGEGMRYLRFDMFLADLFARYRPDLIAYEEVRRHKGTIAAHVYGGFQGILTRSAEAGAISYSGVPVGKIKKHATGQGNAGKEQMIQAARARGHDPVDDNEADALAILYYSLDKLVSPCVMP